MALEALYRSACRAVRLGLSQSRRRHHLHLVMDDDAEDNASRCATGSASQTQFCTWGADDTRWRPVCSQDPGPRRDVCQCALRGWMLVPMACTIVGVRPTSRPRLTAPPLAERFTPTVPRPPPPPVSSARENDLRSSPRTGAG